MHLLDEAELTGITRYDLRDEVGLTLYYRDALILDFGSQSNFEYKIRFAKEYLDNYYVEDRPARWICLWCRGKTERYILENRISPIAWPIPDLYRRRSRRRRAGGGSAAGGYCLKRRSRQRTGGRPGCCRLRPYAGDDSGSSQYHSMPNRARGLPKTDVGREKVKGRES